MTIVLDDMQTADPELRADIELLKQQVHSCRATLQKLVSTAETHRAQRPTREPIDVFMHELLERWQVVRPAAQFTLNLRSGTAPNIHSDEALRQAIINLLDNGADTDSGPLQLNLGWTDTHIELRIRDHGPGIGFDIAEQLGKPFITNKGKGLGLGLFLSHATIERCGGEIRLYNHAEGGTEAILRLPIADERT
jgi:two-component system sensor histidine kinase RegB